jgi:hypothetical protein
LAGQYGQGFTYDNLTRMVKLAELFPEREIVGALSRELGWSHFVLLLPVKEDLKREFYGEMCRLERWSVRTLRDKMGGMLYERTAVSKKPAELAKRELASLRSTDQLSAVELMQLGASGIRVATYLTELPPKALLERKLRAAADLARSRLREGASS